MNSRIATWKQTALAYNLDRATNTTNKKVGTSIAFMGINPLYKLKKQQVLHIITTPAVSMSKFIYIHGYILSVLAILWGVCLILYRWKKHVVRMRLFGCEY